MIQTTVQIHGMASSSAAALIGSRLRKRFPEIKNVSASHWTGTVKFMSETPVDAEELRTAIDDTGYRFVACETIEYERRSLFRKS